MGTKMVDKCDCVNKFDLGSFSNAVMLATAGLGTRGKLISAGDSSSSELVEVVEVESPPTSIRWLQGNSSSSGEAGR